MTDTLLRKSIPEEDELELWHDYGWLDTRATVRVLKAVTFLCHLWIHLMIYAVQTCPCLNTMGLYPEVHPPP